MMKRHTLRRPHAPNYRSFGPLVSVKFGPYMTPSAVLGRIHAGTLALKWVRMMFSALIRLPSDQCWYLYTVSSTHQSPLLMSCSLECSKRGIYTSCASDHAEVSTPMSRWIGG